MVLYVPSLFYGEIRVNWWLKVCNTAQQVQFCLFLQHSGGLFVPLLSPVCAHKQKLMLGRFLDTSRRWPRVAANDRGILLKVPLDYFRTIESIWQGADLGSRCCTAAIC